MTNDDDDGDIVITRTLVGAHKSLQVGGKRAHLHRSCSIFFMELHDLFRKKILVRPTKMRKNDF